MGDELAGPPVPETGKTRGGGVSVVTGPGAGGSDVGAGDSMGDGSVGTSVSVGVALGVGVLVGVALGCAAVGVMPKGDWAWAWLGMARLIATTMSKSDKASNGILKTDGVIDMVSS